jgi:hypothetical protein
MTQDQFRRTVRALAETETMIAKEVGYLPEHRNQHYLADLEAHATKLGQMLREYVGA